MSGPEPARLSVSPGASPPLPAAVREYLSTPAIDPLWAAVRSRLERNGLNSRGAVTVLLDDSGAESLAGLLGTTVRVGAVRVRLDRLDSALRSSAAERGLIAVTETLHGPLTDRKATRRTHAAQTASVWALLDTDLAAAGLAGEDWVPEWIAGLRRTGLLTRAAGAAATVVQHTCAVLGELEPVLSASLAIDEAAPRWELAQLASTCIGDAHGLDDGTITAALVLRAIANATGQPTPSSAAARRELWASVGVSADMVSGTVIVLGLRPPGSGAWSAMMHARADLGIVTHVTLQEWRRTAAAEAWVDRGQCIWACENPQVLQAAAAAGVTEPLLCFGGNPAAVGSLAVDALVAAGADIRYHGDFDVAGIAIAARLHARGVGAWRMSARDYITAVDSTPPTSQLTLNGLVARSPWDAELTVVMNRRQVAIHEEAVLDGLLADLQ